MNLIFFWIAISMTLPIESGRISQIDSVYQQHRQTSAAAELVMKRRSHLRAKSAQVKKLIQLFDFLMKRTPRKRIVYTLF